MWIFLSCVYVCVWSVNPSLRHNEVRVWLEERCQVWVTWPSSSVQSKNGVWCKSRVYCCHISHYLVKTTLRILGQQIRKKKIWVLIMWMVFLANIRRVVLCSQTQSGLLAAVDPEERTMARLGLLRPSRSHRPCLGFTAPVMPYTRATLCLLRATARGRTRTHRTAARLTRDACLPTAAAIRGRDLSPCRRTNSTVCTPGWEHQVCADIVSCYPTILGSTLLQNIAIFTLIVSGSINFVKPFVLHGKNRKTFIAQLMSSAAINSFGRRFCVEYPETLPLGVFSALLLLLQPLLPFVVVKKTGLLCKSVLCSSFLIGSALQSLWHFLKLVGTHCWINIPQ